MTSSIYQVLQCAVESGAVPNVVGIAADRNGVIYEGAAGPREAGGSDPVGPDSSFRIMSMTKMVATVAALQLVERGSLELDAPIDHYRPEWADLQVLEGFDGDTPKLRPAASRATVKQLITHTTGLGYWFWNADLLRWEQVTGTPNVLSGANVIFTAPLTADPGTTFQYGTNIDWLGRVIETASGTSLDVFVKENITAPLEMDDTAFLMSPQQRANSVPVHLKGEDGSWAPSEIDLNQNPEYFAGGHGLHSTPRDYLQFQRMLLGDGTVEGTQILRPETVDAAFTSQIGDLEFPPALPTADPTATCDFNLGPGFKWGYGLLLTTRDIPGMRRAGSGAWAGLCNTHFWVDRTTGITGAIYSQFLPFAAPESLDMYADFEKALYASR
ncbi:serine hydrolase domain-containing protein [Pseudonocardia asaccharolytica]|uniref:1,4-butanediol diacrylate esterase n=1 Tax=Pseudonocardia asaccharolytica DSM 44247 = NBRC 16224 TaxID=1123024 RepID=A0A511D7R7_9PSEU|nr:serine hydrolase domain-containing protein [Pseudonocardia asaccharolytica]GEL18978.1 1,4-butanediol diacrylate esterase [Pseudonocardia asaccharolytica DSM 44247 = NBRC 16224]